jgi:small subunit ribosomal protein S3
MGQKIHPIGFRLGISREHDSRWYAESNYADLLYEDHVIRSLIRSRLKNAAVSRIVIERKTDRLAVSIHTGRPGIIIGRGGKGIDELKAALEKKLGRETPQPNVVEIRNSELDAQLVSEAVAQQLERRIAPRRAMRQAVQRTMRAGAEGIKIQCAGRLGGAEMSRREEHKEGKIPLHTLRADIDYGFSEAMTQYGHIGVKVWIYRGDVMPGARPSEEEKPIVPSREREREGDRRVRRRVRATEEGRRRVVVSADQRKRRRRPAAPEGEQKGPPGDAARPRAPRRKTEGKPERPAGRSKPGGGKGEG